LQDPLAWAGYFTLGTVQYHMHFLPTLFGLVLLFPLYRCAIDRPWFGCIVLVCLFVKRETDLWLWAELSSYPWFDYLLRLVKIMTYAGYGIVATSFYGLYKRGIDANLRVSVLPVTIFVACLLFMIKLVYSHKVILSANWQYNYDPAFWADFLMPVFLFLIFMFSATGRFPLILSKLAPYSFGIYLVHPIFLDLLEILLWDQKLSPSLFVGIKTILGIISAALLTFILSKVQFLGWTVGLGPLPLTGLLTNKKPIEE